MNNVGKLYTRRDTLAGKTVRVVLAEKNLPCQLIVVQSQTHQPTPLWEDPGGVKKEGLLPILLWLEEQHPHPPLLHGPGDEQRLRHLHDTLAVSFHDRAQTLQRSQADRAVDERPIAPIQEATEAVYASMDALEDALGNGPYLLGEHPTLADLLFVAPLQLLESQDVPISPERPVLMTWAHELLDRPSAHA